MNKDSYKILCLCESTTDGEWPLFLENYLNDLNLGVNFTVIDEGASASNSSIIV